MKKLMIGICILAVLVLISSTSEARTYRADILYNEWMFSGDWNLDTADFTLDGFDPSSDPLGSVYFDITGHTLTNHTSTLECITDYGSLYFKVTNLTFTGSEDQTFRIYANNDPSNPSLQTGEVVLRVNVTSDQLYLQDAKGTGQEIPEPASMVMLGIGLLGLGIAKRIRK